VLVEILVDDQYSSRVAQARAKSHHQAIAAENRENGHRSSTYNILS